MKYFVFLLSSYVYMKLLKRIKCGVWTYVCMYLPNSWTMWQKVIFKWNAAGLNLESFFFLTGFLTEVKRILSTQLSIHKMRRKERLMPFLRAFDWNEMQIALLRIWTQIIHSILYDNNHYAKCASQSYVCNKSTDLRKSLLCSEYVKAFSIMSFCVWCAFYFWLNAWPQ